MGLDALCDVAQTLRFDAAHTADSALAFAGEDPHHVDDLARALGLVEGEDADVIVLAEWSPRELLKAIAEGQVE